MLFANAVLLSALAFFNSGGIDELRTRSNSGGSALRFSLSEHVLKTLYIDF